MPINIAIGRNKGGWYQKFSDALTTLSSKDPDVQFSIIDLERSDCTDRIKDYQAMIWNPLYMGLRLAGHFKEKVYFMEKILGKLVFPNFETIWHFESKVAESYLFKQLNIQPPRTYITFDYQEAVDIINQIDLPIVLKKSEGAASKNVRLVHNRKWLLDYAERVFCHQLWGGDRRHHSKKELLRNNFTEKWVWYFILSQFIPSDSGMGVLYLQEYIPNNDADLRITVIGDRYAYGFWRNNRPGDFRASGSGRLVYDREIPINAVHYCQQINKQLHFDTMAYDILFNNNQMVVNEMSYNYLDSALYNTPGYYEFDPEFRFVEGHTWPQELWVKTFYEKIRTSLNG